MFGGFNDKQKYQTTSRLWILFAHIAIGKSYDYWDLLFIKSIVCIFTMQ